MATVATALRPKKLVPNILRALLVGLVPMVTSSPGCGKSDIAHQIAEANELLVIDFRLSQADVTDLNGLPRFNAHGFAEFVPFDFFPLDSTPLPMNPKTNRPYKGWLLFFDEMNAASKQLQAAAYKVVLERRIGNRKLHKNVAIMAAGNRKEDNAVVHDMSSALQSRLIHFELKVHATDWIDWATDFGIDSRILGYIAWRNDSLNTFDPEHTDKTYACPRTWEFTNRIIAKQADVTIDDDLAIIAGTIGGGEAVEFISYCELASKIPKMSSIINDPEFCMVPTEPSQQYAVALMIAKELTTANADKVVTYLRRMNVEQRVIAARIANKRDPLLKKSAQPLRDLLVELAAVQNDDD